MQWHLISEFFLQSKGTAAGIIFAPTYATITMGYVEIKLYNEIKSRFDTLKNI